MFTTKEFINKVEQYDRIAIFRHQHPDYDALGSQYGLYYFLKHLYPEKDIKAGGKEKSINDKFLPNPDNIDESWIKDALVIAVDTSSLERLDGSELFNLAKDYFWFDHHHEPNKPIEEKSIIEPEASSCAEIITAFLKEINNNQPLPLECAKALYAGIISDSIRFSINSTTSETLKLAAYLLESNIDINNINTTVFETDMNTYRYTNRLREVANYEDNGLVWAIIEKKDYAPFHINAGTAKHRLSTFAEISGIKSWAVFVEEDEGHYSASLRSHNLLIRDIAEKYHGGGHDCAAGINKISREECNDIIKLLMERTNNPIFTH